MPTAQPPTKDKRVAFEVPAQIEPDYGEIAKKLGVSRAELATMAARFVIPLLKNKQLANFNGELLTPEQIAKQIKQQAAA